MLQNRFYRIFFRMAAFTLVIGTLLRIVLACNEQTVELDLNMMQWAGVFLLGALNDICVLVIGCFFLWLYLVFLSDRKYKSPMGYIILGILVAAFLYVACCNTIFDEYGSVAPQIASAVLGFWAASYALRLFCKPIRPVWSKLWLALFLMLYSGLLLFNALSEYYFWNEFGVRYNFIAVDYLIYTQEVIGNILESYPMVPLSAVLLLSAIAVAWLLFREDIRRCEWFKQGHWKFKTSLLYGGAVILSSFLLPLTSQWQKSGNVYYNELQANGMYKFYEAFRNNELDFDKFYRTVPQDKAELFVRSEYGSTEQNHRMIASPGEERHPNLVLVTLESMSADFMARYGSKKGWTPYLDSLCGESLVFDRLFATGNRTVRGLEAVTLSLPPCPGQSIIKQPDNGNMHSTGAMLRKKGYDVLYFYGGNSYFDNMKTFFEGNGYEIIDKKDYRPEEITFQNIWGVCDEDAYAKVIRTLNERSRQNKPFFAHVMSVSNHRPFTYPGGRISIPNDSKSRAGGVMYSDYALGQFIRQARQQSWFQNTVFIITADHCASSAGKTALPLEKYHIPAMIYAPALVKPDSIQKIASQIDLMPTVFALLGFDYESWFFGKDILAADFRQRAFLATYQSLGYLEGDCLTVISPIERVEQFRVVPQGDNPYALENRLQIDSTLFFRTTAFYQTSVLWNKRR